ncbi:hypothetical protein PG989_004374 [Apiospora arundinis]
MMSSETKSWGAFRRLLDQLSSKAKNGTTFPTREHMLMPTEAKAWTLEPPRSRFGSMKERSVMLSYATFYEQLYEEGSCATLQAETYNCQAIGIPGSWRQGHYSEYLILVKMDDKDDLELLPRVNKEEVSLKISVPWKVPEVPRNALLETELIYRVTRYLCDNLHSVVLALSGQNADPKKLRDKMTAQIREVCVKGDSEKTITFLAHAVGAMQQSYGIDPNNFNCQKESWEDWEAKFKAFVKENIEMFKHPPIRLGENREPQATRIEVPEALGNIADAVFITTVPRVPRESDPWDPISGSGWPWEAGELPFVQLDIPTMELDTTLAATVDLASQHGKSARTFKATIERREPSEITMKMELAAIRNLTCSQDDTSPFANMSRWLLNFRGSTMTHCVAESFPILSMMKNRATTLKNTPPVDENAPGKPAEFSALLHEYGRLDEDQKAIFPRLESLPHGVLAVLGGQQTGKTHVCLLIVVMACLGMVGDEVAAAAQALVCGVTNLQVDDLCRCFDQLIQRCGLPLKVVRVGMIRREVKNGVKKGHSEEDAATYTKPDGGTCSQIDLEISNIISGYREYQSTQGDIHGGVYAVSEIAYAKLEAYEKNPWADHEYEDTIYQISAIHQTRKVNPHIVDKDTLERYHGLWKDLIVDIISDADICVATPAAAKQLADLEDQPLRPRIVWNDDVGRTTEAAGLASFTFFPSAELRILSGDPGSETMTPSLNGASKPKGSKTHWTNPFVLQLGTSILKRMEQGGAPVSRLGIVHTGPSSES